MARLLCEFPDTDAVICVSDLSAFGALTECQRRGIAVPEKIAIGAFCDYEIGGVSVPRPTTIDAQAREIGRRAGALILGLLGEEHMSSVMIEPQLMLRESSRYSRMITIFLSLE